MRSFAAHPFLPWKLLDLSALGTFPMITTSEQIMRFFNSDEHEPSAEESMRHNSPAYLKKCSKDCSKSILLYRLVLLGQAPSNDLCEYTESFLKLLRRMAEKEPIIKVGSILITLSKRCRQIQEYLPEKPVSGSRAQGRRCPVPVSENPVRFPRRFADSFPPP